MMCVLDLCVYVKLYAVATAGGLSWRWRSSASHARSDNGASATSKA